MHFCLLLDSHPYLNLKHTHTTELLQGKTSAAAADSPKCHKHAHRCRCTINTYPRLETRTSATHPPAQPSLLMLTELDWLQRTVNTNTAILYTAAAAMQL
jgi:hypothetical protein